MRLSVRPLAPLAILVFLSACGPADGLAEAAPPPPAASDPASDYPVVVGDPFTIDGVAYKPEDKLSYDAVGYASVWLEGGAGISAAHKTLPLPSYAEVTALGSGKTILVRIERRGPMTNDRLIELSPGAAMQLGLTGDVKAPVRVRRVNPPEPERAALRAGRPATARMDTPKGLLAVLMRKLDAPAPPEPAATPSPAAVAAKPARAAKPPRRTPAPAPTPNAGATPAAVASAAPKPAPRPATAAHASPAGALVVQVGTFAVRENADRTAARLGGSVEPAGRLFRVRMGRYATQADAASALAKARAAGYSDARIQRAN